MSYCLCTTYSRKVSRNDMSFWNSKPKRLIEKIKPERKKGKNNEVWVKHQCRNDRWWRRWCMEGLFALKCFSWNSITVLKLLRAFSKSWTRSSDHVDLVFEPVPAAATCWLVLLVILFFVELFRIQILLFCCCFLSNYACTSSSIDRVEWFRDTSCTAKRAARFQFTLI